MEMPATDMTGRLTTKMTARTRLVSMSTFWRLGHTEIIPDISLANRPIENWMFIEDFTGSDQLICQISERKDSMTVEFVVALFEVVGLGWRPPIEHNTLFLSKHTS
ncbi:uncharacterized protein [Rhodnius prolixus]|uniref:uncharacterized protein n=1 Tax=Rhodnius prolixus TaxID=13249 RepID=UPI003D189B24